MPDFLCRRAFFCAAAWVKASKRGGTPGGWPRVRWSGRETVHLWAAAVLCLCLIDWTRPSNGVVVNRYPVKLQCVRVLPHLDDAASVYENACGHLSLMRRSRCVCVIDTNYQCGCNARSAKVLLIRRPNCARRNRQLLRWKEQLPRDSIQPVTANIIDWNNLRRAKLLLVARDVIPKARRREVDKIEIAANGNVLGHRMPHILHTDYVSDLRRNRLSIGRPMKGKVVEIAGGRRRGSYSVNFYPGAKIGGSDVGLLLDRGELSVRNPSVNDSSDENTGGKYDHRDRWTVFEQSILGWTMFAIAYASSLAMLGVWISFCFARDWRGVLLRFVVIAGLTWAVLVYSHRGLWLLSPAFRDVSDESTGAQSARVKMLVVHRSPFRYDAFQNSASTPNS